MWFELSQTVDQIVIVTKNIKAIFRSGMEDDPTPALSTWNLEPTFTVDGPTLGNSYVLMQKGSINWWTTEDWHV